MLRYFEKVGNANWHIYTAKMTTIEAYEAVFIPTIKILMPAVINRIEISNNGSIDLCIFPFTIN